MTLHDFKKVTDSYSNTKKMPVLFVGHGNPLNAIEKNTYSLGWETLGKNLPQPNAILSISAHWLTEGTFVHISQKPKTIHDFWGFPQKLYKVSYPCPGAPDFAADAQKIIKKTKVQQDSEWGIDHGTWVVLMHLFPKANIPVFEMSIDVTKPSQFHFELGRELAKLREKGVLIMGTGNIVHNLGIIQYDAQANPFDWAIEFDALSKKLIEEGNFEALINYHKLGHAAQLSIPTPDHYWPMLSILGLRDKKDTISFPINGIAHGSISMRAFLYSAQ